MAQCIRNEKEPICLKCGARSGEDCPFDDNIQVLLDRQRAVTAGQSAECNPSDGVCDACQ